MEKKVIKAFIALEDGEPIWISTVAFDGCDIPVTIVRSEMTAKTIAKLTKLLVDFHSDRFADSYKTLARMLKILHIAIPKKTIQRGKTK